jgi:hypothetical protein
LQRRNNRRGLRNWASTALQRTCEFAGNAASRVTDAVPEAVEKPIRHASAAVANTVARPALKAAMAMLELVNETALELSNPKIVEKPAY